MTQVRRMVACPQCGLYWPDGGAPGCAHGDHQHRTFEFHVHRTPILLPDGTAVIPVSFDAADPYGRDEVPDFGLYLDERWRPPWPHQHLEWPDFGVPGNGRTALDALGRLLDRARTGERVEVGCLGGHGRTGTALACLAVLVGHPPERAVEWVRAAYCARAVETPGQEAFVAGLAAGG